jgi:hypothetical protein
MRASDLLGVRYYDATIFLFPLNAGHFFKSAFGFAALVAVNAF